MTNRLMQTMWLACLLFVPWLVGCAPVDSPSREVQAESIPRLRLPPVFTLKCDPMWEFFGSNYPLPPTSFGENYYDPLCGYVVDMNDMYGRRGFEINITADLAAAGHPLTNPLYCASYKFSWSVQGHNARTDKWITIPDQHDSETGQYDGRCFYDPRGSAELSKILPYDKVRVSVDAHYLGADGTPIPIPITINTADYGDHVCLPGDSACLDAVYPTE